MYQLIASRRVSWSLVKVPCLGSIRGVDITDLVLEMFLNDVTIRLCQELAFLAELPALNFQLILTLKTFLFY